MGLSGWRPSPQDNNTKYRVEFPKEPSVKADKICQEFGHCLHDVLEVTPDERRCRIRQDGATRQVRKCCVCLNEFDYLTGKEI